MLQANADNIFKTLSIIHRKTGIYLNERLAHLGLNSAQMPFVLLACQKGTMPQNRMGELLGMDKSTVAKTVAKLESLGYLQRQHSGADGRILDVSPTPQAFLVQGELERARREWASQLTQGMSEVEVAILFDLVRRLEQNVGVAFATRHGVEAAAMAEVPALAGPE